MTKRLLRKSKSLDLIEREAWQAWEQSKTEETTHVVQKNGEKKVEKTIRKSAGDPRFLQTLLKAKEKRSELLGLYRANSNNPRYVDWASLMYYTKEDLDQVVIDVDLDDCTEREANEERENKLLPA